MMMHYLPKILSLCLLLLLFSCEERIFKSQLYTIQNRGSYLDFTLNDDFGNEILLKNYDYNKIISLTVSKEFELRNKFKIWQVEEAGEYQVFLIKNHQNKLDTFFLGEDYFSAFQPDFTKEAKDQLGILEITMLDVKQGDCLLIDPPCQKVSIVDGGYGSYGYQDWQGSGRRILSEYLDFLNIDSLSFIIETHSDLDHSGGLQDILEENFYFNHYLKPDDHKYYPGDTIFFSNSCFAEIINYDWPEELATNEDENEKSITFNLNYQSFSMLFTGDITSDNEEIILNNFDLSLRKIEILKAPHHGSKYSNSEDFLNQINPLQIMISAGEDNPFTHPHPETLERYRENKSSYFSTIDYGTLKILTDGNYIQILN